MTSKSVSFLNEQMLSYKTHNWSTDPFSMGAYSYIGKNGMTAAEKFRRGIYNTLFFAGEAAISGSARGTVHGAMQSGDRVGKLLSYSK